jgi:hypothetical protein
VAYKVAQRGLLSFSPWRVVGYGQVRRAQRKGKAAVSSKRKAFVGPGGKLGGGPRNTNNIS